MTAQWWHTAGATIVLNILMSGRLSDKIRSVVGAAGAFVFRDLWPGEERAGLNDFAC